MPTEQPAHVCQLRPDYNALAEAIHGMYGRLLMLEARVADLTSRLPRPVAPDPHASTPETRHA